MQRQYGPGVGSVRKQNTEQSCVSGCVGLDFIHGALTKRSTAARLQFPPPPPPPHYISPDSRVYPPADERQLTSFPVCVFCVLE